MVISLWSVSHRRQRRLSNYVALGVFACIIASSKLAIALIEETDPLPANLAKDEYFDRSFFESKVTEFHQVFLGVGGLCCGLLLLFLIKVSVFNMEFGIRVRTIIYMIMSILIFYAIRLTPKSGHPSEVEALDFLLNHNDPEPSLFEEWILFGGAFATLFWQKILSVIVLCWFYNSLKKEKIAKIAIQVKHARRQSQIRTPLNVDDTNETVDVEKPPTDKKKSWFRLF
ncbi:Hypothetical protein NTJ_01303 [Nesidiocoris tenuis]|uniref:Uncharacterized protein n=1 Tax=Nesidiocoris tenuis TaxID=355587 RepID=A0ABN7A874_9HEMI|nr:Hypothetical protein NTJ_01303 [Nesidiocoris tenuis]